VKTSAGARTASTVIGEEFAGLLAAAQGGGEAAFSRLWRNANPALLRYLRVIAPGAEEDIAAETWPARGPRAVGVPRRRAGLAGVAVHHGPAPHDRPGQAPLAAP